MGLQLSKPRAVVFDFGGVLCFHPTEDRFERIARVFGISTTELLPLFWAKRADYDAAKLDARAYWSDVAKNAGVAFDEAQLPALIRYEIELWNDFDERILSWAAHLKAQGIGTGILSNLPYVLGEELRVTPGFLDPFDQVTFSYELGLIKPQAEIYRDALRGLDVAPGEVLFLDDRRDNVEGACAVGMLGELYSTWEEFLDQSLKRYELPPPALAQ